MLAHASKHNTANRIKVISPRRQKARPKYKIFRLDHATSRNLYFLIIPCINQRLASSRTALDAKTKTIYLTDTRVNICS